MRIDERIRQQYQELSPQEQKAADTLLDRLGDLATFNAAELANLSGVSKATMSRLFRRLGFTDFNEVKDHTRTIRSSGVPLGPRSADTTMTERMNGEVENLHRLFQSLDTAQLEDIATRLATAPRVLLIGFRNSFPIALHLRQQLLQCRTNITLAPHPGQSIGEELAGLDDGDVVVLFGFRRRPESFQKILKASASTGAVTILVGDPSARGLAADADTWLECPLDGTGAFDSYAAAMALVSALADSVLVRLGRTGRDHVRKVTGVFDSLEEIEWR